MATVSEIAARCAAIAEDATRMANSLDYEANEISATRERIQGAFGDQVSGQRAVMALGYALDEVIGAETAMRDGRAHGADFISRIIS